MTTQDPRTEKVPDVAELSTETLRDLRDEIAAELDRRESDVDLADAESADLVAGKWARWRTLSAHANKKATKAWMLHVTDTHDKFGVDGDWLTDKTIDGDTHMDVSGLEGEIIKVSGASHNNKKHRYYRVLELGEETMYYERMSESDVVEEVSA